MNKINFESLVLLPFTAEALTTPPPFFDFENPDTDPLELAEGLKLCMFRMQGVGLSANQVGLPYRVFVMGMGNSVHYVFNPEIVGRSPETEPMKEGCLSLPGIFLTISRPKAVVAKYFNEKGEPLMATFDGMVGRIFQHEYDHMEGKNFTSYASPLKMQRALKAAQKQLKKAMVNANV